MGNSRTMVHLLERPFDSGGTQGGCPLREWRTWARELEDLPADKWVRAALLVQSRSPRGWSEVRRRFFFGGARADAQGGAPMAWVVGRHSRCDVADVVGASLRHMLVLLWPPRQGAEGDAFFECFDLRTPVGLMTAKLDPVDHLADRRGFQVSAGSASVLGAIAPKGEPFAIDTSGAGAAPVFVRTPGTGPEATLVVSEVEPVAEPQLLPTGEEESRDGVLVDLMTFTADQLAEGVLLGRYPRCDGPPRPESFQRASRVHVLVVARFGRVWAIDLASSNGTLVVTKEGPSKLATEGPTGRAVALQSGDALVFGGLRMDILIRRPGVTEALDAALAAEAATPDRAGAWASQ